MSEPGDPREGSDPAADASVSPEAPAAASEASGGTDAPAPAGDAVARAEPDLSHLAPETGAALAAPADDEAAAREKSLQLRIACGVLATASRFVPVLFLDDYLREKAFQLMVSRTLRARGRTIGSASVAPLYQDPHGCLYGCLVAAIIWPFKLMFGWILSLLLAARNLAKDLSEAVLLGRILDRQLDAGQLANGTSPKALKASAKELRVAFDLAVKGTDMVLLRGALANAVSSIQGLFGAGFRALGGLRKEAEKEIDPTAEMSAKDRAKIDESARRVSRALDTDEMRAFFAAFDARFDEHLARILADAPRLPEG